MLLHCVRALMNVELGMEAIIGGDAARRLAIAIGHLADKHEHEEPPGGRLLGGLSSSISSSISGSIQGLLGGRGGATSGEERSDVRLPCTASRAQPLPATVEHEPY